MTKKTNITAEQKEQIKLKSWSKLANSPNMIRFKEANETALRALFIGYWPFVDGFPAVIQSTYEATEQFSRLGKILSGALREMETDERNHRALWLISAAAAGISEENLYEPAPLHDVERIIGTMVERETLWERLLDFVAVEIVAEGISVFFLESQNFCDRLGKKGTAWFKVHVVHPSDQTTHEDLAYRAAISLMPEGLSAETMFELIDKTVQETVDRFIFAANACLMAQETENA